MLDRDQFEVNLEQKHDGSWVVTVEAKTDDGNIFRMTAHGEQAESAFANLVRDLACQSYSRHEENTILRAEIATYGKHKLAISQFGPQGYVSPVSQATILSGEEEKEQS